MRLVFYNLRELWRRQKLFFLLLILVQMLGAVCLSFAIGVIINERAFLDLGFHDYIYVRFDDPITYGEIEDTVLSIFSGTMKHAGKEITLDGEVLNEVTGDILWVWARVGIENGRYVNPTTGFLNDMMKEQLAWGRILTEEEQNSAAHKAIVTNYSEEELLLNGDRYEIIGAREVPFSSFEITPTAIISPIDMREVPLFDMDIRLNRFITEEEFAEIEAAFAPVMGERTYYIFGVEAKTGDTKAMMRTVILSCVLVGVAVIGTLLILYQHILNKRAYKQAVFRLTGCSRGKAVQLLLAEVLFVSIPSLLAGYGLFYGLQKWKLEKIYPYMELYLDRTMYVRLFCGALFFILLFFSVVAAANARHSVRRQLSNVKH